MDQRNNNNIFSKFYSLQQTKTTPTNEFEWFGWNNIGSITTKIVDTVCLGCCIRTRSRRSKWWFSNSRGWRKTDLVMACCKICGSSSISIDCTFLCSLLHGTALLRWLEQLHMEFIATIALHPRTATNLNGQFYSPYLWLWMSEKEFHSSQRMNF